MLRFASTIGCATASVAWLMLGVPAAHADDASFVRDAKALGFGTNADNLISMARSACYYIGPRNRDPDEVAERIKRYGNVDLDAANRFLALSVAEYCPLG
jgi:hypothetical protein